MNTLVIQQLDINLLIDLLSNKCSDIVSKVWREGDFVGGVFILEEGESSDLGVSITTILDYDKASNTCRLTIHAARVAGATVDPEAAEARLRQTVVEFAAENDWPWN